MLCKASNDNSHDLLASFKNQIDYLLSEIYFLREEIPGKNLVFVNINKKYAGKVTSAEGKHEKFIQEKCDSVTSISKESAQSNKDSERNLANNQEILSQIIKKSMYLTLVSRHHRRFIKTMITVVITGGL